LNVGEMRLIRLGADERVRAVLTPSRGFDVGAGPGKRLECELRGGTVGLMLDARGRPLMLPGEDRERRHAVEQWCTALQVYGA
jgi:hypothetical protein